MESLLWEREAHARLLEATALPDPAADPPMLPADLTALLRACRWSARMPFIDPDGSGPMDRLPISAPFHGAVQVEDYQLVPLLKALRVPRVSLPIADDVGLGKTIEAGLILAELILRRRIRRVLVMTPASLRVQWRDELSGRFSLPFEIVQVRNPDFGTDWARRPVLRDGSGLNDRERVLVLQELLDQERLRGSKRQRAELLLRTFEALVSGGALHAPFWTFMSPDERAWADRVIVAQEGGPRRSGGHGEIGLILS